MSATIMDSAHIEHKKTIWNRWVQLVIPLVFLMSLVLAASYLIRGNAKRQIQHAKTIDVLNDLWAFSHPVALTLDAKGIILKSSDWGDEMFTGGKSIEGRNVHSFCSDQEVAARAQISMEKWCAETKPGEAILIKVTAHLGSGKRDIVILAKRLPHEPGSDAAVGAEVFYSNKFHDIDLRNRAFKSKSVRKPAVRVKPAIIAEKETSDE